MAAGALSVRVLFMAILLVVAAAGGGLLAISLAPMLTAAAIGVAGAGSPIPASATPGAGKASLPAPGNEPAPEALATIELAQGEETAASGPAGAAVLSERAFGEWIHRCVGEPAAPRCFIEQRLGSQETSALVALWRISKAADGTLSSYWQVRTGLQLTPGLRLRLGGGQVVRIPFSACGARFCVATAKLEADLVERLRTAVTLGLGLTLMDGKAVAYQFATNGFREALAALG
jgi:invasion protein IalB